MKKLLVLLSALLLSQSALASVQACIANETRKPIYIVSQLADNYQYSTKVEANSMGTTGMHISDVPVSDLKTMRVCANAECKKVLYTMDKDFISSWNKQKYDKSTQKKYFVKVSLSGTSKDKTVSIADGWCPK